jgi:tRNA 2-thiouridine synthesizing protein A
VTRSDNDYDPVPAGEFEAADRLIDASGLLCPEPLVLCRQALDELEPGALVHVVATDPHAEIDFEVFARRSRHRLLESAWQGNCYHVLICKG